MKKLFTLLTLLMVSMSATAQDEPQQQSKFPYEKMLRMSDDEYKDAKFKFDDERNQWVLRKLNGLNQTSAVLSALAGSAANYVPHINDYTVVIQKGEGGAISSISVTFYDPNIYHEILTFAKDNGENLLETTSGKIVKNQFSYNGYSFDLSSSTVSQAAISTSKYNASTKDQSYDICTFSIFTGVAPQSQWLTNEAEKQARRDAKGKKKQSAADLM